MTEKNKRLQKILDICMHRGDDLHCFTSEVCRKYLRLGIEVINEMDNSCYSKDSKIRDLEKQLGKLKCCTD